MSSCGKQIFLSVLMDYLSYVVQITVSLHSVLKQWIKTKKLRTLYLQKKFHQRMSNSHRPFSAHNSIKLGVPLTEDPDWLSWMSLWSIRSLTIAFDQVSKRGRSYGAPVHTWHPALFQMRFIKSAMSTHKMAILTVILTAILMTKGTSAVDWRLVWSRTRSRKIKDKSLLSWEGSEVISRNLSSK